MDVEGWLQRLGMEQYASAFRDNAIDAEVLPRLTAEDLKEIGVAAVGHRRKLIDAISALGAEPAPIALAAAPALLSPRVKDEAERRPITVMFCDLVGSTSMAAVMDAEDWRELVGAYLDEAAKAVDQYGGHVLKKLGDGLMALFGYPRAQENDAERAARAGLAILRALETLNAKNAARGVPLLAARIGLQSGPVVVDSSGEVFGDAPNVAARVQAAAEPGTLFVTALVNRQLAGFFVAEDKGPHELKGVPGKPVLYRVMRVSGGGRKGGARTLTALVGREEELATLTRRWERVKNGEGQFVQIVGEPGLGKSRLLDEFRIRLADTPHTWVEWASSQLLQNTPLHPLVEWGQQRFVGEEKFAELEAALAQVKLDPVENAPLLALLLDIPTPEGRAPQLAADELRRRQLGAVAAWILAGARAQPLVLAIEDLHWADPTTLDLMKTLAERGSQARLLILATARPEFRLPWTTRSHHSVISLSPLDRFQIVEMVGVIAARHALSKDLVEGLSERTAGVPLFIEELTRFLLEGGAQTVPPSLQQSLAARLDRLGEAREVAQIGAVLGREFSHALLAVVADIPTATLEAALEKLAEADLLFIDGVAPVAVYRFKHALIQDAAYGSLLKARRQTLHRRAAEALAASSKPQPELVAHHFTQCSQVEQAIQWWGKAGDAALRRSSFQEAIAHLGKAIEMADAAPTAQTAKLQSDYRRAVAWGHGHWSDNAAAVSEFSEQNILSSAEFGAADCSDIGVKYMRLIGLGKPGAATALFDKVSGQLQQLRERGKLRWAHWFDLLIGVNHILLGECQAAYARLKVVADYFSSNPNGGGEPLGVMDDHAMASTYLMVAAWQIGAVGEALAHGRSALARASTLGHLSTLVNCYAIRLVVLDGHLDRESLLGEAERLFELAEQSGNAFFLPAARMFRTYAVGLVHQPSVAAANLRAQLADYMASGARIYAPGMYRRIAELEMRAKEWTHVRSTIEEALRLVEGGCDPYMAPSLHRLLGAYFAQSASPDLAEARRALSISIDIATAQGARSERLLSALALARLSNPSFDDLWEARQTLAAAFEGFETETEFPAAVETQALLQSFDAMPEIAAALDRERNISKIRSDYRRAVAWGSGQWSDRAAAAFDSVEQNDLFSSEHSAAHYSEVFILIARYWGVGNLQAATVLGEKALRQLKDRGAVRWTHSMGRMVAMNYVILGDFQAAYVRLREVVAYFASGQDDGSPQLGVMDDEAAATGYLMLAAWHVGAVTEAFERGRSALERASALGHLGSIINCYLYRVMIADRQGDHATLLSEAKHLLDLSERSGIPFYLPVARMYHTYASGLRSEPSAAAESLREQLTEYMRAGARLYSPGMYGCIAELEMVANAWGNAKSPIEDALKLVEQGCDPYTAAYLYRLLGRFHAQRDAPDLAEARRALRTSIDIASAQGARSERLLSALALARLPNPSPDDWRQARQILAAAFEGFEAESEFPAAVEAQVLLQSLDAMPGVASPLNSAT